ncbi:hypothetical protein M413DRAFT_247432 [Hebeloma cylindrosporum]|uniref:Uncharacterized protein n=1 Tax=Hebeloma cylindrosporum TaxID=76867 RepID=A0A0C3C3M8_HEBCY|nr:hypothetical protein M413DRAFT_247432 [Hebeloma cylindrosporum h7]
MLHPITRQRKGGHVVLVFCDSYFCCAREELGVKSVFRTPDGSELFSLIILVSKCAIGAGRHATRNIDRNPVVLSIRCSTTLHTDLEHLCYFVCSPFSDSTSRIFRCYSPKEARMSTR